MMSQEAAGAPKSRHWLPRVADKKSSFPAFQKFIPEAE
jgi:hypothetical protein